MKIRDELVAITRELHATGVLTGIGGNVSARTKDGHDAWITPKQVWKGGLTKNDLARIDLEGEPLPAGPHPPSSERRFHAAILRVRPDVNAIVHGHSVHATTLTLAGLTVVPVSTECALLGEVPVIPYLAPGSRELAEAVGHAFSNPECLAVLLRNHGLITVGATLRAAADLAQVVEHAAHAILACRALGKEPPVLSHADVEEIRRVYR